MTSVGSAGARVLRAFDRLDDRVTASLATVGGRPPFDSTGVSRQASRWALPVWFALISLTPILGLLRKPDTLFLDVPLDPDATRTWMNGGEPWSVRLPRDRVRGPASLAGAALAPFRAAAPARGLDRAPG